MHKLIGALCVVAASYIGAVACQSWNEPPPLSLTTNSTNNTYTVHLTEELKEDDHHRVLFDVSRSGQSIINGEPLYGGSKWDGRFYGRYPKHNWVTDSIIRFGHTDQHSSAEDDVLEVVNKSSTTFSYFYVNTGSGDMYLLFDFQPGATVTLFTEPQSGTMADYSEFDYRGRYSDGRALGNGFAGFDVKGKYKSPAHYTITVEDSGVSVSSKEFAPLKRNN